jgi:SAM-dependent methyltransferase
LRGLCKNGRAVPGAQRENTMSTVSTVSGAGSAGLFEVCEICGAATAGWDIGRNCVLMRCTACGHLHRSLDLCFANARGHAWGGDGLFNKVRTALTFRRMRKLFLRGGKKLEVFEIGFGSGALLKAFLDRGHSVGGIEKGMTELETEPALKGRAALFYGSAEDLDLPAGKYDLVQSIHVIEHVTDTHKMLEVARAALKDGGALYMLTPDGDSLGLKLFRSHWWNLEDPTHIRFFSRRSMRTLLESAGFRDIRIGTPVWDSLTLEPNSLVRVLRSRSGNHGVMSSVLIKVLDMGLFPIALLFRVVCPRLSPTMEIRARK